MNTLSIMQPMALNPGSNQATEPLRRIRAFIASFSAVIARFLTGSMPIWCSGAILNHSSKSLTALGDGAQLEVRQSIYVNGKAPVRQHSFSDCRTLKQACLIS